jgi:hypothetical protein
MLHDGFAGNATEIVDLDDLPAFHLGIEASAFFVMLGAFPLGLVEGGDAEEDGGGGGHGWSPAVQKPV